MPTEKTPMSISKYFALYKDKRLLSIFGLGVISGFPWVLIGSAMTAWLQEAGLTRSAIGFFGSVFAVYAFNFLWAPVLDSTKIPMLEKLGRRRSWIIAMQGLILVFMIGIAITDPSVNIALTSVLALGIALASATQDAAIDAYRIEIIEESEENKIPAGAAMATSGWWTGYSLPGAAALMLSDQPGVGWDEIYILLGGFVIVCIAFVLYLREPVAQISSVSESLESWSARLLDSVINPLTEFFRRNGVHLAIAILSFIFLFKIGEAFLGRMSIVFYKEVGFTNTQIAQNSKLIGWGATIFFSLVASAINIRFGLIRGLFISGIAMATTNLMFTWIALVGPVESLFAATVIVDQFTASFATVSFVSFISYLTHRAYTATQYALMASIGNLGRTTLAVFSGVLVDYLGGNWALFFVITAVMVIPSLILLLVIRRKLGRLQ